jgi:hypothetical protein
MHVIVFCNVHVYLFLEFLLLIEFKVFIKTLVSIVFGFFFEFLYRTKIILFPLKTGH